MDDDNGSWSAVGTVDARKMGKLKRLRVCEKCGFNTAEVVLVFVLAGLGGSVRTM